MADIQKSESPKLYNLAFFDFPQQNARFQKYIFGNPAKRKMSNILYAEANLQMPSAYLLVYADINSVGS